jgi:hypothetical protein
MPLPDISRPVRVDAKSVFSAPTSATPVNVLTCPTNQIYRIRTLLISNNQSVSQTFSMWIFRPSVDYRLYINVTVPPYTTFSGVSSNNAIYMEPGDILKFSAAGTAPTLQLIASYEVISG